MNKWFNDIINCNLDQVEDDWDQRALRLINTLIFSLAVLMILFFALSFVIKVAEARSAVGVILGITVLHFWVSQRVSLKAIKLYVSIIPILLVVYVSTFVVGIGGNDKFYFVDTLVLPMLFFKEKKWYLPLSALSVIAFFLTSYLQTIISPFAHLDDVSLKAYALINGFAICMLAIIMIKSFKNEILGFQDTISKQKKSLEIRNKEVTESITYAKGIQEAILPSKQFLTQEFAQGYVLYLPKDIVAGDFYWIEKVGGKLFFAAADCTGHGVPGAMVSVVCHGALQQSLHEYNLRTPGEILQMTSKLVSDTFSKSEREVKDGMDIALCAWDEEKGILEFAGANNPLWIISSNNELHSNSKTSVKDLNGLFLHELKGTKKPIGNSEIDIAFQNHKIQLSKSDEVFLQTDGFADQFGGIKGKKYKYNKLKEFLLTHQFTTRKTDLKSEFHQWIGEIEQVDDICLVGFKC